MTSWTMCWRGSLHLGQACHGLVSPSTSPHSSSMASLLSTTVSVPFSWVSEWLLPECRVKWTGPLCVAVWGWSCVLPEDAQTIVGQLARKRKSQKIDMDDLSKWAQMLNTVIHSGCIYKLWIMTVHCCCVFHSPSDKCFSIWTLCLSKSIQKGPRTPFLEWCARRN